MISRTAAAAFRRLLLALAGWLIAVPCAANTIPNLGTASSFGLFGLNDATYVIQSATMSGNFGIGQGGSVTNNSGTIAGSGIEYSSGQISSNGTVTGGISVNASEVSSANSGAMSGYNTAVADTATQTFGAINSATTITGNGGLNVISISSVSLSNASITLNGTSSDIFVLRVSGNFTMSGTSSIRLDTNVTPEHVLIVFTGSGQTINIGISGSGVLNGTLLAPSSTTNWQIASGTFDGEIITGTSSSGGGTYINMNNVTLAAAGFHAVPEPSSFVLATIASIGLISMSARARRRVKR